MQGRSPDEQRLPEWITTVYTAIEPHIIERDEGLPPNQAAQLILDEVTEELALELADAEYALQRLLERGYLYKVDESLYVTEPQSESPDS
jgi:predicted transcriptional regulator of viral defense system